MALIVEDGTGVAGAESYNTVAELRTYATNRGYTLPAGDTDVEVLARQATDFLETFWDQYKGIKTDPAQDLSFPRYGVFIEEYEVAENEIPEILKKAHAQATVEAYESDLQPNSSSGVKKEKVDVLEVEYSETSITTNPTFRKIESMLERLLSRGGFSIEVKSV